MYSEPSDRQILPLRISDLLPKAGRISRARSSDRPIQAPSSNRQNHLYVGGHDRAAETTNPLRPLNNFKPRNHPLSWSQNPPALWKRPSRPQPLWVPNSTQNPRPHSRAESRSASHWARSNGGSSHEYYILEKRSNTDFRFAAIITSS